MATAITACIIARDEAALMKDCLAALDGVDEVVVVDHGSTDDTAKIARAHGARVLTTDEPSHEIARNTYLDAVTTPWILVVDADERATSVRDLVANAPPDVFGYALERFDYIGGGHWASTRLVRLFRRDPRIRYFASRTHASVAPSIVTAGGRIALGHAPMHHLDALLPRDPEKKRARMRRLLETDLTTKVLPPIQRCFLALEHFALGDEARGDAELSAALAEDARTAPIVTLFRAQRHRENGRFADAAAAAAHALSLASTRFRGRTSAHAVLADALDRAGRHDEAVAAVRAAIAEEPDVASHRVNLAALTGDDDERALARRLNPWLDDPRIHARGARPSIFVQQDAILARVRTTS